MFYHVLPCSTMFYRTYSPAPPLREFIDNFWLCSDTPPHSRERILPSGMIEKPGLRPGSVVFGDACLGRHENLARRPGAATTWNGPAGRCSGPRSSIASIQTARKNCDSGTEVS